MQSGGNVVQSMLARLILNMTSQQPSHQDVFSHPMLVSATKRKLEILIIVGPNFMARCDLR